MSYAMRRNPSGGGRARWLGLELLAFIACTHCSCSGVIVAEPSDSALMRVKLSTIAPTNRLSATKEPTTIHSRKKADAAE